MRWQDRELTTFFTQHFPTLIISTRMINNDNNDNNDSNNGDKNDGDDYVNDDNDDY